MVCAIPSPAPITKRVQLTTFITLLSLTLCHCVSDPTDDLLVLSSWQTIKYWSTNSSLHSSKELEDLNFFESNQSTPRRITAIKLYSEEKCRNVLVWCELVSKTLYESQIQTNGRTLSMREPTKLLRIDFGSYVRLAVDSNSKQIYLSLYDLNRIDIFDIENRTLSTLVSNISHPNDIAFDSQRRILFWIENWQCLVYRSLNDTLEVRMCSNSVRALAVDQTNALLFWSDINGTIYQKQYSDRSAEQVVVFTARKMQRNLALSVTRNAIYLSDEFKLMAIDRQTLKDKIVLVESTTILDMNAIESKDLCLEQEVKPIDNYYNYSVINKTNVRPNVIQMSPLNTSLTIGSESDNSKDVFKFNSFYYILIFFALILIVSILILSVVMAFKHLKRSHKRNAIKRITGRRDNRLLISDKRKLIVTSGVDRTIGKTVQIEDLGSFSNSFLDQSVGANRALRQACSSCEDREECLERGICLTTYKLLT